MAKNQSEEGENKNPSSDFFVYEAYFFSKKVLTDRLNGDMVNYTSNEPINRKMRE